MKALVKSHSGSGLSLEDVPQPVLGEHDVLIKVKTTGICGTDLHIYEWNTWAQNTISLPLIIGHEFVGEVVKLGTAVTHHKIGDRVSGEGHLTCGICRVCRSAKRHLCPFAKGLGIHRDGVFAEYICLPAENVVALPPEISDEMAAILDPLGNAVHTVHTVDVVGENILITGAGPIGLMASALLRMIGAHTIVITDPNPFRLQLANALGANYTINTQDNNLLEKSIFDLSLNNDFTVGLEMSGSEEAVQLQLKTLAPGSTLAILGLSSKPISLDWNTLVFKGITFKGIYGREMFETWTKAISLLQTGLDLSSLITHRYHFSEYKTAFEMAKSGQAGKILMHW